MENTSIFTCLCIGVDRVKHRPNPLILEFGVASGRSLHVLRHRGNFDKTNSRIFGFDSFFGLPEKWRDGYDQGAFSSMGVEPPHLQSFATIFKGLFADTIPEFIEQAITHPDQKIDLLHVDCDLYSSTKTIFDLLGRYIGPDTVIVFDELFNYPGWEDHEWKALNEFMDARGCTISPTKSLMVRGQEQALIQLDGL